MKKSMPLCGITLARELALLPDDRPRDLGQHAGGGCDGRCPLRPADGRDGHRWGKTTGKVGFHGGKVEFERPRVRRRDGGEVTLPSGRRRCRRTCWASGRSRNAIRAVACRNVRPDLVFLNVNVDYGIR